VKSYDEPLFVLKYQKRKVILWVLFCLWPIPLFYYAFFVYVYRFPSNPVFAMLWGLMYLFFCVPFVTEMVLFKEIRFYSDRIVKAWSLIGTKELELAQLGLGSRCSPQLGIGGKYFFERGMNPSWRALAPYLYMIGITYQESFADRRDVKQLNTLLAQLSGRKVEEFEQTVTMGKLIKDEKS